MDTHLAGLVREVAASPLSDFYRRRAGMSDAQSAPETWYGALPVLIWEDIADTPFDARLYRPTGLLTKIVSYGSASALVSRTRADLSEERFMPLGDRPLVLAERSPEAVERAMWFSDHCRLPLMGEREPRAAAAHAAQYRIDSILTDTAMLEKIGPHLAEFGLPEMVTSVGVADRKFSFGLAERLFPRAAVTYALALPEAGCVAHACPQPTGGEKLFHPDESVRLIRSELLQFSKVALLPTPLLRYMTDIRISWRETCACGIRDAFALQ